MFGHMHPIKMGVVKNGDFPQELGGRLGGGGNPKKPHSFPKLQNGFLTLGFFEVKLKNAIIILIFVSEIKS